MASMTSTSRPGANVWLRGLLAPLILIPLIFFPAGTWEYWQGWVYLVLNVGVVFVTLYALRGDTELIQERLKPGQGMMRFDKFYFGLSTPLYLGGVVLASYDGGKFGWSPALPGWLYALSIALFVGGQAAFLWCKLTNRYFSSVVRIQTERGHTVCREGPYHYVRHPGYAVSSVWTLAMPLMLGSLWALIPAILSVALLVWRTGKEDAFLHKDLPGYAVYAQEVKYRLVPGIW